MSDLQKISKAQLSSVLTAPAASLQKSLSAEDSTTLLALMDGLTRRYPSQDQQESIGEFFADYEQLAVRKGMQRVVEAVQALRIDPEKRFFPRPDEVAAEIDRQHNAKRLERESEEREHRALQDAKYRAHLMSPNEIAWRIAHFGYDPFAQKIPTATK
jgi:hypothetical protein